MSQREVIGYQAADSVRNGVQSLFMFARAKCLGSVSGRILFNDMYLQDVNDYGSTQILFLYHF